MRHRFYFRSDKIFWFAIGTLIVAWFGNGVIDDCQSDRDKRECRRSGGTVKTSWRDGWHCERPDR